MRRIVVVGAGFFGRLIARRLADQGIVFVLASRRGPDTQIDVEDRRSIARVLRPADVVVDTAGPFQTRSTYLVEAAIARGCDVVDLSDAQDFARRVSELHERAAAADVRLVTSCSAIVTVAAAAVTRSGIASPTECDIFLAPASAETGSPATVRSFVHSLGGLSRTKPFPRERRSGHHVDSSASLLLPASWPSLGRVDFWVDPNAFLASPAFAIASRISPLRALITLTAPLGRVLGRRDGVFAVTARDGATQSTVRLSAPRRSYLVAAEPAAMVAAALARGERMPAGIVPARAHVHADELFERLRSLGVSLELR